MVEYNIRLTKTCNCHGSDGPGILVVDKLLWDGLTMRVVM